MILVIPVAVFGAVPPDDAAADYVAERTLARMNGVHGQMMTDDFVFDYYEDVFTGAPTCMIRLPMHYESASMMPMVLPITSALSILINDDAMIAVVLSPQSVRLWIPDPDGNAPGIRLKAAPSPRIHTIGAEHWIRLEESPGYMLADSEDVFSILSSLYNADQLQVNPNDSPTELQRYDMKGFFTAMNTARRLCPDNLPRRLLRGDRNPRENERVFNALEPSENDSIVDLRGQSFPIDTPAGRLDVMPDASDMTQILMLDDKEIAVKDSKVEAQALINLSGKNYVLVSHICTRCGNAYDAGTLLKMVRLDTGYRNDSHLLDRAWVGYGWLEQMSLSLEDGVVHINIPNVGTYDISQDGATLAIEYQGATILDEIAELNEERNALRDLIDEENRERPAIQLMMGENGTWQRFTGTLHRYETQYRNIHRPDERLSAYTLALDAPLETQGDCATKSVLSYIDLVSDDQTLAKRNGQRTSVRIKLSCGRWNPLEYWLRNVSIEDPDTVEEAMHARPDVDGTLPGNWSCHTRNPDGTGSNDRYRFNADGTFVSASADTRVSGRFDHTDSTLALHFTRIITKGTSRAVSARTSAQIVRLGEQAPEFTSLDATTSEIRRVSCRPS